MSLSCNARKRLLTNAEWRVGALGTPDPGAAGDGVTTCNTAAAGLMPTGSARNCVSDVGVLRYGGKSLGMGRRLDSRRHQSLGTSDRREDKRSLWRRSHERDQ